MSVVDGLADLVVPIDSLQALPGNPRKGDVEAVAASLARFGQRKPIVVRSSDRTITAGNHTWLAAKHLGWSEIAAVVLDDDDATAGAYALADNRTAELGGYDEQALLDLIRQVGDADPALLADTGWSDDAVRDLVDRLVADDAAGIGGSGAGDDGDPDEFDNTPPADPITQPGDVWTIGPHRIICGDCRDASTVSALMRDTQIDIAFTSPPYADARKYDEASGFTPIHPDEYVEWFAPVQSAVADHMSSDGSWFVNIKAKADGLDTPLYVLDLVIAHVRRWGWHFATEL